MSDVPSVSHDALMTEVAELISTAPAMATRSATDFFRLPLTRVVEIGTGVEM